MTRRRDLKRHVRDRQARTGESYMTALRHVQADAPAIPIPFVELIDLTELAAALGMHGSFAMYPQLLDHVAPAAMLSQFRAALRSPRLATMRAIVIDGESRSNAIAVEDVRGFRRACIANRPSTTRDGLMTALPIDDPRGTTLVAFVLIQAPPLASFQMPARLMISPTTTWSHPWLP